MPCPWQFRVENHMSWVLSLFFFSLFLSHSISETMDEIYYYKAVDSKTKQGMICIY
jgi:hypothetical protein